MKNTKTLKKITAVLLTAVLLVSMIPTFAMAEPTADDRVVDPSTADTWKDFFDPNLSSNAGAVWSDKSVFTSEADLKAALGLGNDVSLSMDDPDNHFLVAMSALAANKSIVGYSAIPTDTMLVLDLSNSMSEEALKNMVTATNAAIRKLLNLNRNNRVGVVLYAGERSGNNSAYGLDDAAFVLLPLASYNGVGEGDAENFLEYVEEGWVTVTTTTVSTASTTTTTATTTTLAEPTTTRTTSWWDYIFPGWGGDDDNNTGTTTTRAPQSQRVYQDAAIRVINGVTSNSGTSTDTAVTGEQAVGGATYIQAGLWKAWKQFETADTVIPDGVQEDTVRMPVLVLMSDGAPTVADSDYDNVAASTHGSGSSTSWTSTFLTQLSAAWVRGKMEQHYGRDALVYTLGLNVGNTAHALAVLDPANYGNSYSYGNNADNTLYNYWDTFLNTDPGSTAQLSNNLSVQRDASGANGTSLVTSKDYVTSYYGANNADGLITAFDAIVNQIVLQSRYYPTHAATGQYNLDGYMVFYDELGDFMEVSSIKGILADGKLYKGSAIAQAIAKGSFGDLTDGDMTNLTTAGLETLKAIEKRLGCTEEQAEIAVSQALINKQLYYNSDSDYSNYIGWYSDANDQYLTYGTGNETVDGAKYYNRSYGFLGQVGTEEEHNVTDMLYISVRVREEIATGNQFVIWAIPATLIPTLTYSVSFNGTTLDEATDVEMTTNDAEPIRLVFETGLDDTIKPWNVAEKAADHHHIEDGIYRFFTNTWGADSHINHDGDHDPTWMEFEPSRENETFYYIAPAVILDASHNPVTTDPRTAPAGTRFYHAETIFEKTGNGNEAVIRTEYVLIGDATLQLATLNENGEWVIPKGSAVTEADMYRIAKSDNKTGTYGYRFYPVEREDATAETNTAVYAYMGNNGTFTMTPSQGVKITKTVDVLPNDTDPVFVVRAQLTAPAGGTLADSYPTVTVAADGTETIGTATVRQEAGVFYADLSVRPNQTVYLIDLPTGTEVTLVEQDHSDYRFNRVTDLATGTASTVNQQTFRVAAYTLGSYHYENSLKTGGGLYIRKTVNALTRADVGLNDKEFTVKVDLGAANAGVVFNTTVGTVTADEAGVLTLTIKGGHTIGIYDIPGGTAYTVTETNLPGGFTMDAATSTGLTGTIVDDQNVTASLVNTYRAAAAYPVNLTLTGDKILSHAQRGWQDGDSFTVVLERLGTLGWERVATRTMTEASPSYDFTAALQAESFADVGPYSYQVREIVGDIEGMVYDIAEKRFNVIVEDPNLDGQLVITAVEDVSVDSVTKNQNPDRYDIKADVTNGYTALGTAEATIEIQKQIVNDTGVALGLDGFTFGLYDTAGHLVAQSAPTDENGLTSISRTYGASLVGQTFTYTLKEIVPDPVPAGWSYSAQVYDVFVSVVHSEAWDGTVKANVTFGYDNSSVNSVVFENTYDLTDTSITITGTKTLPGITLTGDEFSFVLKDADGNEIETVKNAASGTITFTTLPITAVGTYTYTVSEVNTGLTGITYDDTVFTVSYKVIDNGEGALVASLPVISKGGVGVAGVNFTNGLKEDTVTVPVTVDKTVIQDTTKDTIGLDGFKFQLSGNGETLFATTDENGDAAFELSFTKADAGKTFTYTLTEVNEGVSGVTYSTATYTYVITVGLDGNYELTTTVTENGEPVAEAAAEFENRYGLTGTEITIAGNKTLPGITLTGDEFRFVLKDEDGNEIETVKNAAGGAFSFTTIPLTKTGTYTYTVSEVNTGLTGVDYDDTVFTLTYLVEDNGNGGLTVSPVGAPVTVAFENTLKEATVKIPVTVDKTVTQDATKDTIGLDGFKFQLAGNGETLFAITDENGDAAFELSFTKADAGKTFTYTLTEVNEGVSGVTYSTATYTYVIAVGLDGNYELTATVTENGESVAEAAAEFENSYGLTGTEITITGSKTFEEMTLKGDDFSFVLKDEDGGEIETVKNAADGSITFTTISLTKTGTYTYTVSEVDTGLTGVTYDDTVYTVTVTVTDDGKGGLTAAAVITADSEAAENALFVNVHTPDTLVVPVTVDKTVEQDAAKETIGPDGFKFQLLGDGEPLFATTDEDGKATIELSFTKADVGETFTYTLSEVDEGAEGVTYSDKQYTITVTVGLDDNYELTAAVTVDGEAAEQVVAAFTNRYEPVTPTTKPTVPTDPIGPENPDTGVNSGRLWALMALLFVSGAGAFGVLKSRKTAHN